MDNNFSWGLDDYIAHYGKGHGDNPPGRGSGRYPWGSGAKNGKTPIHERGEKKHKLTKGNSPSGSTNNVSVSNSGNRVETSIPNNSFNANKSTSSGRNREAERKAALESGDRSEIAKYFNESSYAELQQALQKADLKDRLNESLAKAYAQSHPQQNDGMTNEQRQAYVRQELWSGDINRVMAVSSDPSINSRDLNDAINKAIQVQTINRQLNPTIGDRVTNTVDTAMEGYNKLAPIYNVAAMVNNQVNSKSKLPVLPVKQNNQQKQQKLPIIYKQGQENVDKVMNLKLSRFKDSSTKKDAESKKNAVIAYNKKYNDWYKRQSENDVDMEIWTKLYESLGSNNIIRAYHVAKKDTPAAKKYISLYEKWSAKQDKLDEEWKKEVEPLYKATGDNLIDRIVNNIKYTGINDD